jgi:hypothetical protein
LVNATGFISHQPGIEWRKTFSGGKRNFYFTAQRDVVNKIWLTKAGVRF